MKYSNHLIILGTALLLGFGTTAVTANDEAASKAEKERLQAQLEAAYKKVQSAAEQDRQAAEASMEKAREQLHLISEQRGEAHEKSTRMRAAHAEEMEKMHEELNQTRRQLRETSREIARVNREVARARASSGLSEYVFRTSDRPVIGVILGDANDVGIEILGVSPDGPSERAGIQPGDVIVAMGGRVLAAVDESGDPKSGLSIALKDIRVDEPLIVSVERGDQTLDLTVVPEVRKPLTMQISSRFPSAPSSPDKIVRVERIVIPEINTEELTEQIERIRVEVDERQLLMESGEFAPHVGDFEFEFHEMSEMGNFALHDANIWFGLPMAQGLKLAEIDPGLGEYFKTDRGVLVLKARQDNELQLESGDVILQVGDTEVNSPAEFMRALRGVNPGDELEIDIKRNRKDRTLKTVMPENQFSFFAPEFGSTHSIKITTESDQ